MLAKENNPTPEDGSQEEERVSVEQPVTLADDVEASAVPEEAAAGAPQDDENELETLREELAHSRDRALRAQADFDNYRKRAQREIQDSQRYAAVNIARDLLPVVDNMQRALEAAQQAGEEGSLLQGVQMVAHQMQEVLAQHGLQQIEAEGRPFDPDLHEAVSQQPDAEAEPGTVLHVVQVGFQLGGRVVRPAKVIVAQAAEEN
ncbi:MAG: nucleotide exchange factor GrpE [Pirellulales bacterium]|nr:nucleotide exchange factor GrpE [Pirellulales bacterium]